MVRVGLMKHPISYKSMRDLRWERKAGPSKKKNQIKTQPQKNMYRI